MTEFKRDILGRLIHTLARDNGKVQETVYQYDPDGTVREERRYVAGRLDGTCVRRESNLFVRSRTYSEGLLHGPSMTWSPNGRIHEPRTSLYSIFRRFHARYTRDGMN